MIKREVYQDILQWFPIKGYHDNQIFLKQKQSVWIYRVEPINFKLKSPEEQEMILTKYQRLLKALRY